jgi:Family of unknown function (DUF6644)
MDPLNPFDPIPHWILDWMESTWINHLVVGYAWSWPTLETLHFVGMCLLFGPIIIMDLRLAGFDRASIPVSAVHTLIPLTISGFAINLITGTGFLFGDPYRYAVNISFQLKMLLVLIAGINAVFFWVKVTPLLEGPNAVENPPAYIKAVGILSLLTWTGVLCFGRLIPYLGTG